MTNEKIKKLQLEIAKTTEAQKKSEQKYKEKINIFSTTVEHSIIIRLPSVIHSFGSRSAVSQNDIKKESKKGEKPPFLAFFGTKTRMNFSFVYNKKFNIY